MELLEKAQKMIFKMLQQQVFSHEISTLKSSTIIHRSSSLFKFDSFLDTDGVLRVDGRVISTKYIQSSYFNKGKFNYRSSCNMVS